MIKHLTQHGNSAALIIDKAVMENRPGLREKSPFFVTT